MFFSSSSFCVRGMLQISYSMNITVQKGMRFAAGFTYGFSSRLTSEIRGGFAGTFFAACFPEDVLRVPFTHYVVREFTQHLISTF